MASRNYLITQASVDRKEKRRVYPRRDANCPVIARVRQRERKEEVSIPCWLVNLCEDGCLVISDYFPSRIEDITLTIPGMGQKVRGKARGQGDYTINVKFAKLLETALVERIARLKTVQKS